MAILFSILRLRDKEDSYKDKEVMKRGFAFRMIGAFEGYMTGAQN
jgi:hypothetical protein